MLEKWIPNEKRKKYDNDKVEITDTADELKIEGINVKAGISMTGGTLPHYIKTLTVFYKDGIDRINEIRGCIEINNIALYTTLVHAVKSASASIGADKISRSAYELEAAGKNEDVEYIRKNTEEFLKQFDMLLQNINHAIAEIPDNHTENESTADNEDLKNELINLKSALKEMQFSEINLILSRLETYSQDKKTSENIFNISQNIILYEYDKSIALIDEMLSV